MRSEPAAAARARALVLACLSAQLIAVPPAAAGETLERVLAVVDERPVLLSEVQALQAVLGTGRAQALEAFIDERLMHQQALRLPQAAVSAEEEEGLVERLLEQRPDLAGIWPPELRRLVRRQAAIYKLVEFRFRPQVRLDESELHEAFREQESSNAGAGDFEAAEPELRERLVRRALDRRIEAWVQELRAGAEIRYTPDVS
jgi:hypothetical protein